MATEAKILLIMGSTRAGRICPKVTEWVADIGRGMTGSDYEIIDLADWRLPMDDEPGLPALGVYIQEHTRAWSEKIKSCNAVIFVTPQFNWGYPAVLKNAIDHLYLEWREKPAMIVTYGGHGGGKCAVQLLQVMASVKMRTVHTSPAITLSEAVIREGVAFEPERDAIDHLASIEKALTELNIAIIAIENAP
ncbi:NAD(P)H-dependent oxidoreductase [Pseudomonas sp. MAFF 301449]|uniref:NAD(P)H-dependent oxidoreductase n=1 Tax=Pseudomonas cyclaminis TaxID=2781239 RepID=A0ABR9SSI5_9PSED|nr:NADPH-dependent FMN reductase [Pseudomonas cyclaminis]MBE8591564.1 NAD(P)H-dependent oxidoreductase [Pseudomonas cyclaminis]MBE8598654.1 NAD(P)H-dependent oxidoreductase [Pseudomonas cyclaminis]